MRAQEAETRHVFLHNGQQRLSRLCGACDVEKTTCQEIQGEALKTFGQRHLSVSGFPVRIVKEVRGNEGKLKASIQYNIYRNKTDPRTRMQYTKSQSKTHIIYAGQREESAAPGKDLRRLLSSLILVNKCYHRLLSTTRVKNIDDVTRREKT